MGSRFNVDALRNPNGYKRVCHFNNKKDAERYADEIRGRIRSHRFKPMIEKVKIGLWLGYRYYVCVPSQIAKDLSL